MAIVAWCNTILGVGPHYLVIFEFSILPPGFGQAGLQKAAAAAAAVVVGSVRGHVDEIFFAHDGFYHKTKILGDGVSQCFADDLTGILYCKFYLKILIPVRTDFKFALSDPFGVIFNDALCLELVWDVEFFQSDLDCKEFVPSLRVEPDLASKIIDRFGL